MTAAAGAARLVQNLSEEPGVLGGRGTALLVVVTGGLVEGTALGVLQGSALSRRWQGVRRSRYAIVTVIVAGLGWAAGSAPGVLAGDEGGPEPPLALVLAGAVGIGLVMGAGLGAAQAWALSSAVRHPWRWVVANTAAWPVPMATIYLGATRPGADWSLPAVLLLAALTGAVAGALLGLITGQWLSRLDEQLVSAPGVSRSWSASWRQERRTTAPGGRRHPG